MTVPTNLPQVANIQGLWHLNEATGNAVDASPNGNTLTETVGTIASATGVIKNCRDFELGDTEYFTITDANQTGLDITGGITICAWIKLESVGANQVVASKFDANGNLKCYRFEINSSNEIQAVLTTDGATNVTATSTGTLASGNWYHIAFTLNQATNVIQTYLAGLANGATTAFAVDIADKASPFAIGASFDTTADRYFDGLIDEVIVWNTCLTAVEVLQVKNITAYSLDGGFILNMMR